MEGLTDGGRAKREREGRRKGRRDCGAGAGGGDYVFEIGG